MKDFLTKKVISEAATFEMASTQDKTLKDYGTICFKQGAFWAKSEIYKQIAKHTPKFQKFVFVEYGSGECFLYKFESDSQISWEQTKEWFETNTLIDWEEDSIIDLDDLWVVEL